MHGSYDENGNPRPLTADEIQFLRNTTPKVEPKVPDTRPLMYECYRCSEWFTEFTYLPHMRVHEGKYETHGKLELPPKMNEAIVHRWQQLGILRTRVATELEIKPLTMSTSLTPPVPTASSF